jgi:hypothetical protein
MIRAMLVGVQIRAPPQRILTFALYALTTACDVAGCALVWRFQCSVA